MQHTPPRELLVQAVNALEHQQDPKESIRLALLCAQEAEKSGDMGLCADAWSCAANASRRQYRTTHNSDDLQTALTYAQKAVDIAKQSSQPDDVIKPLYNLAKQYVAMNHFSDAVASYDEMFTVIDSTKKKDDPHFLSEFYDMQMHREYAAYKNGDTTAIDRLEQALSHLEQTHSKDHYEKDVWVSGGYLKAAELLTTDDTPRGMGYLIKARDIIHANPQLVLRMTDWWQVASTYSLDSLEELFEQAQEERTNGHDLQALADYEGLRSYALSHHMWQLAADCLHMRGIVFSHMKKFQEADSSYEQALEEFKKINDHMRVGAVLRDRGVLAHKENLLMEAKAYEEESIAEFEKEGNRGHTEMARIKLALVLLDMGEADHAEKSAREALASLQTTSEWYFLCHGHRDLGRILLARGKKEEARQEFLKAREILNQQSRPDEFLLDREKIETLLQESV